MKKNIALIYGGEGAEASISVRSAESVYGYINKNEYRVYPVFISPKGEWILTEKVEIPSGERQEIFPVYIHGKSGILMSGEIIPLDAAIPLLHGDFGEDGRIQGALDTAHVKYVGCGVTASAVCADKILTKMIADGLSIPTADWIYADTDDADVARRQAEAQLGYPMFIKPAMLGSSIGAAAALDEAEFTRVYSEAARYGRVLIERLLPVAYEVECAILSYGGVMLINPAGTVQTNGAFYDYRSKYDGARSPKTSHRTSDDPTRKRIAKMARVLAEAIGISHLSRIDFLVTRDGEIYFNEINTIPGMTATSLYPLLTEGMGLARGEFINRLLAEITS